MQFVFARAETAGIAAVAVAENVIVVKNEISVVEEVDDFRRIGEGERTPRPRAAIEMLAPGVQGRANDAAGLPFNSLLGSARIPDGCLALSRENVDDLTGQGETAIWNP